MTTTRHGTEQYRNAGHERLAATTAVSETPGTSAGADTGAYQIRGVAIGESDITRGRSGKRTRWPADVLEAAAESLAGEQAKLVRGRGGEATHYGMDDQIPPEDIVGAVSFGYEPNIGLTVDGKLIE